MNIETELDKIPKSEWPAIWCSLNRFEIHDSIKHLKPDWWPETFNAQNYSTVAKFLRPVMAHIRKYIPDEVLNREWNKNTMTAEEHKIWYRLSDEEKIKYFEPDHHNSIP